MNIDDTMGAVAAALRDAIHDTPDDCTKVPPEDVHHDLAVRFLLRLARQGATILPIAKAAPLVAQRDEAARRTFATLTDWLRAHPECSYVTEIDRTGRVEVTFLGADDEIRGYFSGVDAQDAHAQAAQALILDGGAL